MLKTLTIKNYALIDNLSIGFNNGFSVITGETGAGKSILLGALSLILGKRANPTVLKDKNIKCVVEGEFDISKLPLQQFFESHDLDYDTNTFLRREILPSGKSRAFINDTPVTLDLLKEIGVQLVDIHSQHQTLMLSNAGFQLDALDGYLGNAQYVSEFRVLFKQFVILKNNLESLMKKESALKQEEDYLKFQFEELEEVLLDEELFQNMEDRQQFLIHAEDVMAALDNTQSILMGDEHNVVDRIALVRELLRAVIHFYPKAEELLARIESVWLELKDMADEIAGLQSDEDINPNELEELTSKLDKIYRLQQKHRVHTVGELIKLREEISEKLLGITSVANEIVSVSSELEKVISELEKKAVKLSEIRRSGIPKLKTAVMEVLKKLGMKEAVFDIKITALNDFVETGKDRVSFWFSANKGINPGEIAKIASGGELSRLMLAIKSLINEKSFLPTVVFDEIDSGVSGDIAGKVGNIMREMALNHQLIAITHLPQIASKADYHYKVYKEMTGSTTKTNITLLDNNHRVEEIAVMLSDETVSDIARDAAKELLNR